MIDVSEIGMLVRVELIAEELVNIRRAEFARRQTDAVYDQQGDIRSIGSCIKVWRREAGNASQPVTIYFH